mmetsp:Transcript_25371/g.63634  ORF Transcript_25371/g.63634 Transcript_25371/m.63634 type:complete len:212 (-) Transcript_25371:374-1009(-)
MGRMSSISGREYLGGEDHSLRSLPRPPSMPKQQMGKKKNDNAGGAYSKSSRRPHSTASSLLEESVDVNGVGGGSGVGRKVRSRTAGKVPTLPAVPPIHLDGQQRERWREQETSGGRHGRSNAGIPVQGASSTEARAALTSRPVNALLSNIDQNPPATAGARTSASADISEGSGSSTGIITSARHVGVSRVREDSDTARSSASAVVGEGIGA